MSARAPLALFVLALGACSDRPPLTPTPEPPVKEALQVMLQCRVAVAQREMRCASASGLPRGISANLIVGWQHQFVRMGNTAPTTADGVLSAQVTVQNLTQQPMGTSDGDTPVATGVRVFFVQEPTNGVTIANADGEAPFTTGEPQPYFQYSGTLLGSDQILSRGEVSGAKEWRFNVDGQSTFNFTVLISTPVPDEQRFAIHLDRVTGGWRHTCGLTSEGQAYCWGSNEYDQLGNDSITNSSVPVQVQQGSLTFSSISAGDFHTCALTPEGQAYCWGDNTYGQLGNNSTTDSSVPVQVQQGSLTFDSIGVRGSNICALTSEGKAYCWGYGVYGQLGNGTTTNSRVPVAVQQGSVTFASIAVGWEIACGLTSVGQAYCWGYNGYGQLGNNSTTNSSVPVQVQQGSLAFSSITAGEFFTCALTPEGQAYCWGYNGYGQLGDNSTTNSSVPVQVQQGSLTFNSIGTGGGQSCGLTSEGQAYCWGYNEYGQLGNNSTTNSSVPVAVQQGGLAFSAITAAGALHTCASRSTGPAYCWGYNAYGQIGDGTTISRSTPVIVASTR